MRFHAALADARLCAGVQVGIMKLIVFEAIFVFDPKSTLYNSAVAVVPIVVAPNKVRVDPDIVEVNVIGEVAEKDCLIVDDMADTCGTLCNAAQALKEKGAKTVTAYITHPVLSGNAIEKINESTLDQLVVTDTIPLSEQAENCEKIRIMSLAPTLAEAIRRINKEQSISAMMR